MTTYKQAVRTFMPIPIAMVIAIVAISFSSIFVKWTAAPTSIAAMYRLFLTVLIMLPLVWRYFGEIRAVYSRVWWQLIGSGVALGVHFLLWMESLRYTTVASSTALLTLEPVFVMILSFLVFRHRMKSFTLLAMFIAILGAVLIGWGDFQFSMQALWGDTLSFLGAMAVAFHVIAGASLRNTTSTYVYSLSVFAVAGMVLALYNIALGFSFTGYGQMDWTMFLLLAIVPTLFGHYVFNWLLKHIKPVSVSMIVLGEPLGASILAYFLLGEKVTLTQVGAGCVLLLGVWMFIASKD